MAKNASKKQAGKPAKKPVEQQKTTVKEIKVEPKRSAAKEKVAPAPMANDMVDKNDDDKIWIVIAILLILLIGGAFIANKIVTNKKTQESSNNKIYISKKVSNNEDGSVNVKVKIKSKIGLKSVTLEDGTVMNYNGKKEVEVEFTATENKEYKIVIKDVNGKKTTKKISINSVKEVEETEDEEIIVVPEVTYNNNQNKPYYQAPAPVIPEAPKQEEMEEVKEPLEFEMEDNLFVKDSVIPSIKDGVPASSVLTKDGEEVPYAYGDEISDEGVYQLKVLDENGNETILNFTIDKTSPQFKEDYNKVFLQDVNVIAEDANLEGYRVTVNGYETTTNDESVEVQNGVYEIVAYDKAGNESTAVVTVQELINNYTSNMIFDHAVMLNVREGLNVKTFELQRKEINESTGIEEFTKVEGFDLSNSIEDAGVYKLNVTIDGSVKEYNFIIDYSNPEIDVEEDVNGEKIVVVTDDTEVTEVVYGWNTEVTEETPEQVYNLPEDDKPVVPEEEGDYYLWVKVIDITNKETIYVDEEATTVLPVGGE